MAGRSMGMIGGARSRVASRAGYIPATRGRGVSSPGEEKGKPPLSSCRVQSFALVEAGAAFFSSFTAAADC